MERTVQQIVQLLLFIQPWCFTYCTCNTISALLKIDGHFVGYGYLQSHSYFLRVLTEDNWIINSFFADNNKLLSFESSTAHVHTCKYMHVNRLLYSDFNTLNEISHT